MFICPNCRCGLRSLQSAAGHFWACPECDGRAVTVAVLRKQIAPERINHLWHEARYGRGKRQRECPACRGGMIEVSTPMTPTDLKLDVCTVCQVFWFDPKEYDALAMKSIRLAAQKEHLSPEGRQALAMAEIERMRERSDRSAGSSDGPEESWQYIPAVLGMPVEVGMNAVRRVPLMTWLLVVAIVVTAMMTMRHLDRFVSDLGFLPAEAWRYGGLTMLTSFFLHAGWLHLVGNAYFLVIFGDNVEDVLGKGRFLLLILLATIAGDLLHLAFDPRPDIPCVGASGGISGVITFYALRFPRARLGLFFMWLFRWFTLPAFAAFGFWIALQVLQAMEQVAGISNVSAMAHLGGAAVGFLCWLKWRNDA